MANLESKGKRRNQSRGRDKRFYTQLDMAIIKHDHASRNAKINRGEIVKRGNNELIYECGCGGEGCFIHTDFESKK